MWVWRQIGCWLTAAATATAVFATEGMPTGFFHGTLVSTEGTATAGVITARNAGGDLFDCRYDSKSLLEIARQRIPATKLRTGDYLEVLVDHSGRSRSCYIEMLKVLPAEAARPNRQAKVEKAPNRIVTPVTTSTISGVVISKENGSITIRGRDREVTLRVRRDTRFVGEGVKTDLAGLSLNQRVFVEAGRNLDGDLEAYQVTWGSILTVR